MIDDVEVARYAIRTFSYSGGLQKFHSLAAPGDHWPNGSCTARCYHSCVTAVGASNLIVSKPKAATRHAAPSLECTCGIYGALYLDVLTRQYMGYTQRIIAVIAAEGITLLGSRGLRTQYARVVGYTLGVEADFQRRSAAAKQFEGAQEYKSVLELLKTYNIPVMSPSTLPLGGVGAGYAFWHQGEKKL